MKESKKNRKLKLKGYIFAMIALFSWGIHGPAGRFLALEGIDMYFVTVSRLWMGTIVFFLFLLFKGELHFDFKENFRKVIFLSLVGLSMNTFLYHLTLIYLPATLTMILENLAPVFVLFLSYFLLRHKPSKIEIVSLILSFSGLIFILSGKQALIAFHPKYIIGIILGVLTGLTFGLYTFFSGELVKPLKDNQTAIIKFLFKIFFFSAIIMTPLLFRNIRKPYELKHWLWLMEMGIFQSGISYLFWNYSLTILKANIVSILFLFTIFFTTINEIVFLGLNLNFYMIIGGLLIITAGIILSKGSGEQLNE